PVANGLRAAAAAGIREGGGPPRRALAVNVVHNRFEQLFTTFVNATRSPFTTGLQQGLLPQGPLPTLPLLPRLAVGEAGERLPGGAVRARPGSVGYVVFGGYFDPLPGRCRLT